MSEGADGVFHVQVSNGFSQIFSPERAIHPSLAILLAVCTFFASLRGYLCDVQVYQTANGIEANYDTEGSRGRIAEVRPTHAGRGSHGRR